MKIVTFHRKNDYPPKRVVHFPLERDTFRNKFMDVVEDFDEKSYNNNGKPWKSSRILRLNPFFHFSSFFRFSSFFHFFIFSFFSFFHFSIIFFHFSFFLNFSFFLLFHFFMFFHVLSCSVIFFHFLSFSFIFHVPSFSNIFLHVLSCSFMFFHVLSFSFTFFHFPSFSFIFFVFVGCSKFHFFGPQFRYDFSWQFSCEKSFFGAHLGGNNTPLGPSFPFFPTFFF